jgi:hypothetical protein
MPDLEREQAEFRAEAERLADLPVPMQRQLVAEQRAIAADPKVPARDRQFATRRARALARHLFGKKRPRKS